MVKLLGLGRLLLNKKKHDIKSNKTHKSHLRYSRRRKTCARLGYVAFDYELPFYTNKGIIKITDITGKILVIIPIVDSIGQKIWDMRNIKSGVYLYILEAGGTTKSGKLIIQ